MNGENIVLDTNIVLYFLAGDEGLLPILENRFLSISVITEMELLSYQFFDQEELTDIQAFIDDCSVINLNEEIKERTETLSDWALKRWPKVSSLKRK